MNLQRIRGHSAFVGFIDCAGQESMAFPVRVEAGGVDIVMSPSVSSEQSVLRNLSLNVS
jgi:hypothetical protein